jgi:hypothetical protein
MAWFSIKNVETNVEDIREKLQSISVNDKVVIKVGIGRIELTAWVPGLPKKVDSKVFCVGKIYKPHPTQENREFYLGVWGYLARKNEAHFDGLEEQSFTNYIPTYSERTFNPTYEVVPYLVLTKDIKHTPAISYTSFLKLDRSLAWVLGQLCSRLFPEYEYKILPPTINESGDCVSGVSVLQSEYNRFVHIGKQSCEFFEWSDWSNNMKADGYKLFRYCSRCRHHGECCKEFDILSRVITVVVA